MSNLIRLRDGEYPLNERQLRRLVPNVSFPSEPTAAQLARHGFARVRDTSRPPAQPGNRVVEEQPERDGEGVWRQRWRVIQPTQEEIDAAKVSAKRITEERARERMIREMQLPAPIQTDLDDLHARIDAATTIAEILAIVAEMGGE